MPRAVPLTVPQAVRLALQLAVPLGVPLGLPLALPLVVPLAAKLVKLLTVEVAEIILHCDVRNTRRECKRIMREILLSVNHLHQEGLLHRDIK